MGVPVGQMWAVTRYVLGKKFKGIKRYPLVLMLEPLFRCNLACVGCGKIQYPSDILKRNMTPEECFGAAEECGAPVVTIAGGEPLMHPEIDVIAQGMVERKRFVYLCTNAILLEKNLDRFTPSKYLTFSIHVDGLEERHDAAPVGVRDAMSAIKAAKSRGFRVTTNTTVFDGESPEQLHGLFDKLTELGVDGMTISPGYSYAWAPDQDHFLRREQTRSLFREVLAPARTSRGKQWQFNQSPFYLKFLMGETDYDCTPWGSPNYNIFGWQKPCYLLNDGYAKSYKELLESTDWKATATRAAIEVPDCMVHCGFEPTAVLESTRNFRNMLVSLKGLG
jgi:hopanoid biosynthesis associated radical SAM protein HpnH